ncbi:MULTISPECIES: hypothetical protein [unclassified Mesorhizobium]|nr:MULTISPECIES: hypothetical protein [unclassified Mesorhizobium]
MTLSAPILASALVLAGAALLALRAATLTGGRVAVKVRSRRRPGRAKTGN